MSRFGRRRFLALGAGAAGAAFVTGRARDASAPPSAGAPAKCGAPASAGATPSPEPPRMLTRPIPSTGEKLPAVGLGTWQTFDVGASEAERAPLVEVLRAFFAAGGRVIDSSPMYGRAEAVTGDLLATVRPATPPFLATKVWTEGREAGEAQLRESMARLRTRRMDLFQVHNLLDADVQLATLEAWKAEGKVRYVGVTHYTPAAFPALERYVRTGQLDFVQLPYSAATRDAERRLLPAAADAGVAVLVNRPFEAGALFRAVRGKPVPPWARDLGCTAWSQLFLKFILAHPAVTCVLPATSNAAHLADDVRAGSGPLPDEKLRARIADALRSRG